MPAKGQNESDSNSLKPTIYLGLGAEYRPHTLLVPSVNLQIADVFCFSGYAGYINHRPKMNEYDQMHITGGYAGIGLSIYNNRRKRMMDKLLPIINPTAPDASKHRQVITGQTGVNVKFGKGITQVQILNNAIEQNYRNTTFRFLEIGGFAEATFYDKLRLGLCLNLALNNGINLPSNEVIKFNPLAGEYTNNNYAKFLVGIDARYLIKLGK